jgi:UDP-N-acetylglucosamine pyrophosphorylase
LQQLLFDKFFTSVSLTAATIASTKVGISHNTLVASVIKLHGSLLKNPNETTLKTCNRKSIIAINHPTIEKNRYADRDAAISSGIEALPVALNTAAAETQAAN